MILLIVLNIIIILCISLIGCVIFGFGPFLRLKNNLYQKGFHLIPKLLDRLFRILFSCDIPSSVQLGSNCIFAHHGLGVVIHPKTKIGNNCKIFQHVTIGSRNGSLPPTLGDRVYIGVGATIIGDIKIGDNARIGAHALVLDDVPEGCTVVGIPARIVK